MLFARHKHSGYLLVESLLALSVVSLILLLLLPLTLFVETRKKVNREKIEVYRYFSELAGAYRYQGTSVFQPKEVNGRFILVESQQNEERLTAIELEWEGEQIEIIWLSEKEE